MPESSTLLFDVGGVILTNAWDTAARNRAIEAFDYLVDRDLDFKAMYNVGVCHAALGESDKARQAFLQVLELRPGDSYATRALAELSS